MATKKTLNQKNSFDRFTKIILGVAVLLIVAILFFSNYKSPKSSPLASIENSSNETKYRQELTDATASVSLPTTYEIKSGDTLWSIAENFYSSGYNWVDIQYANPTVSPQGLVVGEKITIPNTSAKSLTKGTIVPTVTPSKITTSEYEVVGGDNLWTISLRAYGDPYRWTEIAKANKLVNPEIIHRGNILIIPK